jgi:hypothetical protein
MTSTGENLLLSFLLLYNASLSVRLESIRGPTQLRLRGVLHPENLPGGSGLCLVHK